MRGFRGPAIVRSEVIVRPEAVGRLRRSACMLIAATCAAAMLAAASAGAAPAYAAVRATWETTVSATAASSSGPPPPPRTPPWAMGNQASPTHSRAAWGRAEIAAGVLIICFAALAVQAARRRGR